MHTTLIDTDAPASFLSGLRSPISGHPSSEDAIPDLAFILGLVYLEAGLPPEAALRAGLADFECGFSEVEMESL